MPSGSGAEKTSNDAVFHAPRPAVTNRLGKKRTDELIQADGDTWQEYLAVCEKPQISGSTTSNPRFPFFGKKSKNAAAKGNNNNSDNLAIRSYFENQRTGKKVWDEPPSGASKIVPASEEMRRMADLQLEELYVATSASNNTRADRVGPDDPGDTKKKAFSGIFRRATDKTNSDSERRRIRYKPGSTIAETTSARPTKSRSSFGDREMQQAIELSMAECQGTQRVETEEEILRRVLEESKLEAAAATAPNTKRPSKSYRS